MKVISGDDIDIIVLDGRIDQDSSAELELLLQENIGKGHCNICIDMIHVKHICSSALGVLVAAKKKIRDKDGDIKLVIADDNILKLFQTTMLDKVFEIFESQRECLGAFD